VEASTALGIERDLLRDGEGGGGGGSSGIGSGVVDAATVAIDRAMMAGILSPRLPPPPPPCCGLTATRSSGVPKWTKSSLIGGALECAFSLACFLLVERRHHRFQLSRKREEVVRRLFFFNLCVFFFNLNFSFLFPFFLFSSERGQMNQFR